MIVITAICLGTTALTAVTLSIAFIVNARDIIQEQLTARTIENILSLRDQLLTRFAEWDALVSFTATGLSSMIATPPIEEQTLRNLFRRNSEIATGTMRMYASSNIKWDEPDGFVALYPDADLPAGWDNRERPWFLTAKANPRSVGYTDPYTDSLTGNIAISVTKNIYDDSGKDLGVVAADFRLGFMREMIEERFTIDEHKVFLINRQGLFITHHDTDALMRNDFFNELGLEHYRRAVLDSPYFSSMNGDVFIYSELIPLVDWILVSVIPTKVIFSEVSEFVSHMTFIVIVFLIVAAIVVILLTYKKVSAPLLGITHTLNDIANGEGDLTVSLPETGVKEIADISMYFNQTIKKIRALIVSIKQRAETLSEIGSDLASNMTETASAMNQITANIQGIKGRVLNQSASVIETNATMEQITVNIDKLNDHVERQTSAVSESSFAIEEVLANIQFVTVSLAKNAMNVKDLQESSETGRTSLHEVAQDIQEIARDSEGLLEINSVMEGIASQTNLLSMNAAIEAAHAGDAGRGFAVVADEIRKLAESSGEQSKVIGSVLKKIKASIDKITKSTDSVIDKFEAIDHGVRTVVEQEGVICNAMDEQNHRSKQILEAAGLVSDITRQVKGGAVEMLEGSREVIAESKNLEKMTQEITSGMNEMVMGTGEVNKAVNNVNNLSGRARDNISFLVQAVSRFKV